VQPAKPNISGICIISKPGYYQPDLRAFRSTSRTSISVKFKIGWLCEIVNAEKRINISKAYHHQ
jgi:hypothetical protein